ncbi:MAG: VCBS repeat-containing protein, partial [Proteobacteria bacterium]|nr:VCBS repeat-containing protein [Pseudomonadota bacterium]
DKDGDLDLLLTGYAGYSIYSAITRLYKNDGSGGFEDATVGLPGLINGSLEWGDFDNDGDLDIALAGESDAGAITRVYRNDSGAFVDIQAGLPGVVNGDVAWGDRDNDGDLDLLVTGDTGGAGVATLFDNSNGAFTDANVGLPALTDSAAEWGDFDNDGDLDLVLAGLTASEEGLTEVFRNTGSGLVSIDAGFEGVSDGDVSWGDADNDGDLDLLITGRSYDLGDEDIRLYRNTSDGFSDVSAELPTLPTGGVAWGDYDADGDLDLLLSGGDYVSAFSGVYRNDVASVNTVPDVPFDMSEMYVTPTSYMLSWVAPTDAETPITGLSYNLRIGTAPGLSDIVRPMSFEPGSTTGAEGLQKVAQRGMVNGTNWTIAGLTSGDPYYWSV